MASLHDTPTSSAPIPHFFKIILDDTSKNIRIKIPMKFVMKYGEHLSSPVHLKLPNGAEWEIELRRCNNGGVWFDKGWPEFSKFCSLDYGNWLVFGYEGNSNFHVLIFDRTSTEVEYAITKPEMEETDYEEEDDNSIEILDGFPPCPRKAREKSPLPCPQPHKKMRTCEEDESDPSEVKDGVGSMHASTTSGKAIALQRAIAFESVCPSFTVVMQPSYISYGPLTVPAGFAKRHLMKQPANAILKVSDGGTWSVKFSYPKPKVRFLQGWRVFVRDNNLKLGDVCVFILIKDIKLSFEVVFFRATEAANCSLPSGEDDLPTKKDFGGSSSSQIFLKRTPDVLGRMHPLTKSEKALALQRANAFKSENPYCLVAIQPSYILKHYLHFPRPFAMQHLVKQSAGNIILKILDGRTWPVEFKYENSRARFQHGWSAFARDNNLKVGDVCVFVLIDRNEHLFEVVFYRTNEAEDCSLSPGLGGGAIDQVEKRRSPINKVETGRTTVCENGLSCSLDPLEIGRYKGLKTDGQITQRPLNSSSRALGTANRFIPKNPSFTATVGSTYQPLHVPVRFARSFVKRRKQTVTLQVRERSWPVNLIGWTNESSAKLSAGWSAFATENCLREGDVCTFELIERNDIVLKVHIFRH
ncbi:hypothetical protein L3X38_039157 [Prunus dulcis]|uniref:TF-B3 domain-containing protein n=1 Tax=Prunus dulcis TaxID=3755 RepID=A0AAD4YSB6_PRUDU|nr:hypothetical protein L3X38_039157 [Prunus dulcis]